MNARVSIANDETLQVIREGNNYNKRNLYVKLSMHDLTLQT